MGSKKERRPPSPTSPQSWWKRRNWADLLIGAVIGAVLSTLGPVGWYKWEARYERQEAVQRILRHVGAELSNNFSSVQLKGALTFEMVRKAASDDPNLRYPLASLQSITFQTMAPSVWGQDLRTLRFLGESGEVALTAVGNAYEKIVEVQKDEAALIKLIEAERDPNRRARLLEELHKLYDGVRQPLRSALDSLGRLNVARTSR